MSAWYDLTPADYARGLRYRIEPNLACARHWDRNGGLYSERYRRQARRCEAMALLCEHSDAARAGDVDFRDLGDPTMAPEIEDEIVKEIFDEHRTDT